MDCEMETADAPAKEAADTSADLEWQIDSEWIDLSTASDSPLKNSKKKTGSKSSGHSSETSSFPSFHFIPTAKQGRFLMIENQTLRLYQKKPSGCSYWVCNIPCCGARCVLDAEEKKITHYFGEHNHEADVCRLEYKNFINALKVAVKENPHVKPKVLYDKEVEEVKMRKRESKGLGNEDELCVPSFHTVRTAMYNTRNAVLSSLSLKATGDSLSDGDKAAAKDQQAGPSSERMTRSREAKTAGKRKSVPSKSASLSSADFEELDAEWAAAPHKDASLSDLEDWLEEDVNANISAVLTPKRAIKVKAMPDFITKVGDADLKMDPKENEENEVWNSTFPLENPPRRKYRKRPASSSVFTCPHCPYKSNRHFNVQRHERLAHSSRKPEFSCKECGTSYSLEYRLKLHIKAVHQGEGHHCHICSRTFETMTGLKSHVVTKHKEDPKAPRQPPPPELTCKLCGRVFTSKVHLQKHTATHVMIQPYRCYVCNMAFMEECTWLTHQNNCSDPFTIQCCLCSAVIPTATELLVHMDEVHGRAEYSCNCGKTFPWKKSLLTHQQKCSLHLAERQAN